MNLFQKNSPAKDEIREEDVQADPTTTVVPDSLADLDNELVGPGREAKAIENSFSFGGFFDNASEMKQSSKDNEVSVHSININCYL